MLDLNKIKGDIIVSNEGTPKEKDKKPEINKRDSHSLDESTVFIGESTLKKSSRARTIEIKSNKEISQISKSVKVDKNNFEKL